MSNWRLYLFFSIGQQTSNKSQHFAFAVGRWPRLLFLRITLVQAVSESVAIIIQTRSLVRFSQERHQPRFRTLMPVGVLLPMLLLNAHEAGSRSNERWLTRCADLQFGGTFVWRARHMAYAVPKSVPWMPRQASC